MPPATVYARLFAALTALCIAIAPHVPFLPPWITAAFLGCAAWRYVVEKRRRALPSSWVRAALALGCFLGVFFTYSSISGVGPGSALLTIMAALKLLETRRRRDQFVLLFLSVFLVMSSLLREQYIWSVPYLVVSMMVIMTAWLRMSAGERQTARDSFANGARLLAYAVPLAAVMFVAETTGQPGFIVPALFAAERDWFGHGLRARRRVQVPFGACRSRESKNRRRVQDHRHPVRNSTGERCACRRAPLDKRQ